GPQLALATLAEAIDVPSNRPSKATVAIANALTSSFTVPPCKRSARKRRAYGSTKTALFIFFMKASLYLHDISHDGCFVTSSPSVNRTGCSLTSFLFAYLLLPPPSLTLHLPPKRRAV